MCAFYRLVKYFIYGPKLWVPTFAIFYCFTLSSQTNVGTDFWFAYPEVKDDTSAVFVVNISSFFNTSGTVSVPGQGFSQSFSVNPGLVTRIVLSSPMVEILSSEVLENKAVHVTSNNDITVFAHTEHKFRNEATVILPVTSLGSDYYVLSYDPQSTDASEFLIVGQNNPVTVEITPSANTVGGKPAGVPFTVTLNPGVAYQVQSTAGDLTGSRVRAVNGNDLFSVIGAGVFPGVQVACAGTKDPLYEQLFPISAWGTEYIFIPSPMFNEDACRVIASQNGTSLSVNGTIVSTLNTGQFYEFIVSSPVLISANYPIAAGRYLMSNGCLTNPVPAPGTALKFSDPALVVLNSNEQMFVDSVTFYATDKTDIDSNYVQVITRTTDKNNVFLNGTSIGPQFVNFLPNNFYSYATIKIDTGSHSLTTTGCGFLAYVTGLGAAESYAYSAGVNTQDISSAFYISDDSCVQDTVKFFENSPGDPISWFWNFGDGSTASSPNPTHVFNDTGYQYIQLIVTYDCFIDTVLDSIYISSCGFTVDLINDTICPGICTDYSVTVSGGNSPYSYNWSSGDSTSTINICPLSNTVYSVTVTDASGSTMQDTATIFVAGPLADAGPDVTYCSGDSATIGSENNPSYTYSWSPATGLSSSIVSNPTVNQANTDTTALIINYTLTTSQNTCTSTDSVTVTINPIPASSFTATLQLCENDTATIIYTGNATTAATYAWNFNGGIVHTGSGQGPYQITWNTTGNKTVSLTVTENNCTSPVSSQIVSVIPLPVSDAGPDVTYCSGDSIAIGIDNNSSYNYAWSPGTGLSSDTVSYPTVNQANTGSAPVTITYTVTTSQNNCASSDSVTVTINPIPASAFTTTPQLCGNDNAIIVYTGNAGIGATYTWDFDGGSVQSGSGQGPYQVNWNTAGNKTITLMVTENGCTSALDSHIVSVNSYPVAFFNSNSGCLYDSVYFYNASTINTGTINSFLWNFGDNAASSQQNPAHLYNSAGLFDVKLVVTSDSGCTDSTLIQIFVSAVPDAYFSVINNCLNDSSLFTNLSTIASGNIISYIWEFGDGNTSLQQNPSHLFDSTGTYLISLVVFSDSNCVDTIMQPLVIHPLPIADFGFSNNCLNDTSVFYNSSLNSNIISFSWFFGDGNASSMENPSHLFDSTGIFPVTLIVTTDSGCTDTATKTLLIHPLPQVQFATTNTCVNEQSIFNNTTIISSGNIASYEWNFGDGSAPAFMTNPSYVYDSAGIYTVQLLAISDSGCPDSMALPIEVYALPQANFSVRDSCLNAPAVFSDSSAISNGLITQWNWNFGDSTSANQQNPTHLYTSPGTYSVSLVVTSAEGCRDTITRNVERFPLPVANFSPVDVCFSDSTQFYDLSTISSGSIGSWLWNFGDGSSFVNQQNPFHFYPVGNYTAQLVVISDKGCIDDSSKKIGVHALPVASFNYGNACINEQPVLFSDSSFVQGGTISGWKWDLGVSTGSDTSMAANPSYSYPSAGSYTVTLLVISDKGCRDSITKEIEIYPQPEADFTADTNAGCEPLCVNFYDNSTIISGSIAGWQWNTGNGSTALMQNPSDCYPLNGQYTVSLIAVSDKNCKDTLVKNNYISVFPLPQADFSISPESSTVQNMEFFFSDLSLGQIDRREWLFYNNDNITILDSSDLQNTIFNFAGIVSDSFIFHLGDTGYYPVQLEVTTVNGCKDTIVKWARVEGVFYNNVPNAFSPNGDGINDFFFPVGIGIDPFRDFNFYIFNRWGDLLFESHNLDIPWDGTFKGEPVQQEVYVWVLEIREVSEPRKAHHYVGHVTLIK